MTRRGPVRDPAYLRFVRSHASCLQWVDDAAPWPPVGEEGREQDWEDTVAHHVRIGGGGGVGLKPSDYRTVPLTDSEHRALHQAGERTFWRSRGVDPDRVIIALLTRYMGTKAANLALHDAAADTSRGHASALVDAAEAAYREAQ